MPFKSKKQSKWAFATHQEWADKWAKQTDYKHLPNEVNKKHLRGKMQKGGKQPIIVTNPNDPRLKAYSDSLLIHNTLEQSAGLFKNKIEPLLKSNNEREAADIWNRVVKGFPKAANAAWNRLEKMNNKPLTTKMNESPTDKMFGYTTFKKPVQPVIYQKQKSNGTNKPKGARLGNDPVSGKKIWLFDAYQPPEKGYPQGRNWKEYVEPKPQERVDYPIVPRPAKPYGKATIHAPQQVQIPLPQGTPVYGPNGMLIGMNNNGQFTLVDGSPAKYNINNQSDLEFAKGKLKMGGRRMQVGGDSSSKGYIPNYNTFFDGQQNPAWTNYGPIQGTPNPYTAANFPITKPATQEFHGPQVPGYEDYVNGLADDNPGKPLDAQSAGTYDERAGIHNETVPKPKHNYNTDIFFGLRGAQMAAAFLAEKKRNANMTDYDYKQQSALGQMNPMPVSQFQYNNNNYTTPNRMYAQQGGMMNPYLYHAKYGGNLKTIIRDYGKWSNDAGPMDMTDATEPRYPEMKKGGFALDEMVTRDFISKLMQFGNGPHPYAGIHRYKAQQGGEINQENMILRRGGNPAKRRSTQQSQGQQQQIMQLIQMYAQMTGNNPKQIMQQLQQLQPQQQQAAIQQMAQAVQKGQAQQQGQGQMQGDTDADMM